MKKFLFILILFIEVISLNAQDKEYKTIFGSEEVSITGFGGPFMSFSSVAGQFAHMMGGEGGIIVNNKVLFGGYGIGKTTRTLLNDNRFNNTEFANRYLDGDASNIQQLEIDFGHGGLFAGYVINGNAAFHPVIMLQFGWGGVSVSDNNYTPIISDNIFVLNPILELEMNVTKFLRIGFGANYNLVAGVNILGYEDADFSSPGAFLSFKFGWF